MQDYQNLSVWKKAHELEYHLLLASEPGYLKPGDYEGISGQVNEVKGMLPALINKVKTQHKAK